MNRLNYVGIVWIMLCWGCTSKTPDLPIKEDALIPLLEDVHLAEAALQNVRGSMKDSLSTLYYKEICTIHHIDQVTLDTTLAMLRRDPSRMTRVYTQVIERVAKRNN